jgi:hypothetical protein
MSHRCFEPCAPESGSWSTRSVGLPSDDDAKDTFEPIVLHALAHQMTVEPDAIVGSQDLRRDLGMGTAEIALVLVRLEAIARVEFPHASADLLGTVAELTSLFRTLSRRGPRAGGADDAEDLPAEKRSGGAR